jgi:transposase-like protein
MLALLILEKRQIEDARNVFQRAKEVGKAKPDRVVTDGLHAYEDTFQKGFFKA